MYNNPIYQNSSQNRMVIVVGKNQHMTLHDLLFEFENKLLRSDFIKQALIQNPSNKLD